MKRHLLIAEFLSTPWALMPERIHAAAGVLHRWAAGKSPEANVLERIAADREARDSRREANGRAVTGSIAVLPLYGLLTQRGNMMDDISGPGSTSTQLFAQAFREAVAEDTVGAILIDIDSPGGSVYGTYELAAEILQARNSKPVCAIANSLAASAAYWIGSAASELYVTPGGEVGSIGVYQIHTDNSRMLDQEGVTPTLISAGKYKTEGNPFQPLDEEALSFMQSRVDDYYDAFVRGVAKARNVPVAQVRDGMGQGRCLGASAALAAQMVDGICTFDELVARMQKQIKASRAPAPASRRASAMRDLQLLG